MSQKIMLPIYICWGEEARKKFPLVPDDCFLVYDEWLVDTQGNIINHCPEGGYPDGVAYVSAQLCDRETRDYFYRTIGYGLDTFKGGMTRIRVPIVAPNIVAKQYVDATNIAIQALNAAVKKYGIETCLSKEDLDEIFKGAKEEEI